MSSLPEDLWAIILARLPITIFTTSKIVCKQWKSIVESPYFRQQFSSLHQNSHCSSWSFMLNNSKKEVVSHYGCDTWGLPRSICSYMSSFLANKFKTVKDRYHVWAYTDVGLILISEGLSCENRSLYVANPVSQECVQIPSHAHLIEFSMPLGIATRTENGVLLGFKVVLCDNHDYMNRNFRLLIFSSETGLWSLDTVPITFHLHSPISLHKNIHWLDYNKPEKVVSIDLYATGSIQCHVTPFPDLGERPRFKRSCTTCQGFLMYMNIISVPKVGGSEEEKLCVWRLKSGEWQLVSEITPPFIGRFKYYPLGMNPFDAKTVYFWRKKDKTLVSINLCNGKFFLHGALERSKHGCTLSSVEFQRLKENKIYRSYFSSCVFPQWLHRIPAVRRVPPCFLSSNFPSDFNLRRNNLYYRKSDFTRKGIRSRVRTRY